MLSKYWRNNLKLLRKKNATTQAEMASQFKKSQQTIANWEKGIGEPNIEEIIQLTNLFDISIDDFLKKNLSKDITYSAGIPQSITDEEETIEGLKKTIATQNIIITTLTEEIARLKKK